MNPTTTRLNTAGSRCRGFTLVELMIAIAVLTVIVGIAIPAYNGYIREARLSAATHNIEPLRIALEDFWMENATYGNTDGSDRAEEWDPDGAKTLFSGSLAWQPDGDKGLFNYNVVANTNSYTISVIHQDMPSNPQTFSKTLP